MNKIKSTLILLISIVIPLSIFANGEIWLYFKNGKEVSLEANSFWTQWNARYDYYKYFVNYDEENVKDENYMCFTDYSGMNPVSRATKKGDFQHLKDAIEATGNTTNFFEKQGWLTDDYCVNVRYDQLDSAFVHNVFYNKEKVYPRN